MKTIISICIYLFSVSIFSTSVFAQTNILGGEIKGIWSKADSPFLIMGDITIPDGETLTIEPGVTVEFQGHYGLFVQGRLLAEGTVGDSILFTVNDTTGFYDPDTTLGGWNSIRFIDTPIENDTSKISYCKIQYGKAVGPVWHINAGGALCILHFGKVIVSNCLIQYNIAGGIGTEVPSGGAIHLGWSDVVLKENIFSNNKANGGGAIYIHESNPVIIDNLFSYNQALEGGGIVINASRPELRNNSFMYNTANQGGGVICYSSEGLVFNNNSFSSNYANWGGAFGALESNIELLDCDMTGNGSGGLGGGISADYCDIEINGCLFESDTSSDQSGAIHSQHTELTVRGSEFLQNYSIRGGAIHADYSTLVIESSSFTENTAETGACIHLWNSSMTVDSSMFIKNNALIQAGAIEADIDTAEYSEDYHFNLFNSNFRENNADLRIAAIQIVQSNTEESLIDVVIDHCTFEANTTDRGGILSLANYLDNIVISNTRFINNSTTRWYAGAVIHSYSTCKMYNCLFADNVLGSGSGGGFTVNLGSSADIFNCTFTNNITSLGGGLIARWGSRINATNCIFWNNSPYQISLSGRDSMSSIFNLNYCDIQDGQDSVIIADSLSILNWGDGNINEYPVFVDSANGDYHLEDLSPCIAAGVDSIEIDGNWYYCPSEDIEGEIRPGPEKTLPDLGVFENQSRPVSVDDQSKNDNIFKIINIFPNPAKDKILLDLMIRSDSKFILNIYDLKGRKLKTTEYEHCGTREFSIEYDISGLETGFYIIQIISESETGCKTLIVD